MQKEQINLAYYNEHMKVKDIANMLKVSSAYVTKVIKKDERYYEEKRYRKELSKENRKIAQNKFIKSKREMQRIEDNYLIIKEQHAQASRELSKARYLTNENYRKWNKSAFIYNKKRNGYEFRKELGRSNDVPKFIKIDL